MTDTQYLTIPHLSTKDLTRIFSQIYVNPISACWEWQGNIEDSGYGRVWFQGRNEATHRLMYAWLIEPIPRGRHGDTLDHKVCEVKHCCNPAHLKLGPQRDNVLRSSTSLASLNAKKTHCPQGHSYSPENTLIQNGRRHCRICKRDRSHAAALRKTEQCHADPGFKTKIETKHKEWLQKRETTNPELRARRLEYYRAYRNRRIG